jgi:probable rRNA maturation factor
MRWRQAAANGKAARRQRSRSALTLTIQGQQQFVDLPARTTLRRWLARALPGAARVTLRFVDTHEGRKLNRTYRRRDHATNVLTFDYERSPVVQADIVICVPVARREARAQGKPLRHHLAHLVLHGALHAAGHDHLRARDAQIMEALEVALLQRLRIPNPYN